jgi:hypothetical protein
MNWKIALFLVAWCICGFISTYRVVGAIRTHRCIVLTDCLGIGVTFGLGPIPLVIDGTIQLGRHCGCLIPKKEKRE